MDNMMTLSISRDFSDTPSGRFRSDGPFSGEAFREDFLRGALERHQTVVVELNGTEGYSSSFLEEAFGGLVRKGYVRAKDLHEKLTLQATGAYTRYEGIVWQFIDRAKFGQDK